MYKGNIIYPDIASDYITEGMFDSVQVILLHVNIFTKVDNHYFNFLFFNLSFSKYS